MGIKRHRPTTPSRRYVQVSTFEELTAKTSPRKSLLESLRRKGGRNNRGRITAKRRGGGEKRQYRLVDFRREKREVPGRVRTVEYDPNRSARIALISYADGDHRYILCPEGLVVGDQVQAGRNLPVRTGNAMPLADIPAGVEVHNIQFAPLGRSFLVRSAGTSAQLMAKEEKWGVVRLPSGEIRKFDLECFATVGRVSNPEHKDIVIGKAGRVRHMGRRPRVRAVVMNPVDHPMGGGEGKSSGGRHPCSESGFPAKGARTRNRKKKSSRYIVQRRKK
jgi:large subunit ribosomal protein L2